jgi:hypothetical protein
MDKWWATTRDQTCATHASLAFMQVGLIIAPIRNSGVSSKQSLGRWPVPAVWRYAAAAVRPGPDMRVSAYHWLKRQM